MLLNADTKVRIKKIENAPVLVLVVTVRLGYCEYCVSFIESGINQKHYYAVNVNIVSPLACPWSVRLLSSSVRSQ